MESYRVIRKHVRFICVVLCTCLFALIAACAGQVGPDVCFTAEAAPHSSAVSPSHVGL